MSASPISTRYAIDALLLVAILTLVSLGLVAHWRSPTRGLPYHDSFAADKAKEWQAFGGTWEIVNGAMRNNSDERGAKLITGSPSWQDYTIEGDVMLLGLGGDAGFIVRSGDEEEGVDAYNGYYAALRSSDNSIVVGQAGYGWTEGDFPLKPPQAGVQPLHWYHLKVLAYGCRLIVTAGELSTSTPTLASVTDNNCIRNGRVGLRSNGSGGVWRNVVVRSATQRDVDQMLAQSRFQESVLTPRLLTDIPGFGDVSAPSLGDFPQSLPSSPKTRNVGDLWIDSLVEPAKATIHGVVSLTSPALFVEGWSGGVDIRQSVPKQLKVGDLVEATGIARHNAFSSTLENATVHVLGEGQSIAAHSVTASEAATGAYDARFIQVEGRLRHKEHGPDDSLVLEFDAGSQSFRAIVNPDRSNNLDYKLKVDSLVRVRGIAVVDSAYTRNITPFAVLVRSFDDVEVLAGPPWWTVGHMVAIAISLLILALIANALYQRIKNWRLHAVVEERERLAYEMHDTLAQSVAGIGFQLEAIRVALPEKLTKAHQQLDLASQLVRHSHAEARRSVEMLRPQQLESEGLLNALTNCAHRLVAGSSVQVLTTSNGDVHPLPLRIADTLCRIGQEAIANAVRHAHPTKLTITLEHGENVVRLLIGDDGTGFVEDQNERSFGVLGMRKRAMSISASLEIRGNPIEGTTVTVTAPLPPHITLTSLPAFLWKFLKEQSPNVVPSGKSYPHTNSR